MVCRGCGDIPCCTKSGLLDVLYVCPNTGRPQIYHWIYNTFRKYKDNQLYGLKLDDDGDM